MIYNAIMTALTMISAILILSIIIQYAILIWGFYDAKKRNVKITKFNFYLLVPLYMWIEALGGNKIEFNMPYNMTRNKYYLKDIILKCQKRIKELEEGGE